MVQVTPFKGTRLAEMALQNRNFNAQQQQLGIQNQQRGQQLQQGQDRLDMAAQQLGMEKNDLARQVFLESVSVTEGPEQAAALMEQFLGFPIDDQAKTALSQLPTDAFNRSGRELGVREQQLVPQKVRELTQLRDAGKLTSDEYEKAVRVELGLTARAVGNAETTIAENEKNDKGVTAQEVGAVSGVITGSDEAAKDAIDASKEARDSLKNVQSTISNIDEAIRALDQGANTGAIASRLPSFKTASLELENARRRLGLNIIGATTFGALSKGELDLALDTAIPTGLGPEALRNWLVNKRAAQVKLSQELENAAIFLGTPGNTIAEYMEIMRGNGGISFEDPSTPLTLEEQAELRQLEAEFGNR